MAVAALSSPSRPRPVTHTLRLLNISYQDHHILYLPELRQALISYQDHRMFALPLAGVRAPCDTCPAEMYGRKSCTPKQNRVCAPCARQCKDSSTQAYFEKSSCTLDTPRVCAACRKPCAKGEYQAEACSNSSTRQCTANRVLLFQGRGAARQLFFPRPIPPSFSVLARARLWCLGAPIRVLTSLRA